MSHSLIEDYLNYLKQMCGFALATLKQHKRICSNWVLFLKGRTIYEAGPSDFIGFIDCVHIR